MSTPDRAGVPILYVVPPTAQLEEVCIEGTRQTVFATIDKWLISPELAAYKVLWLADISGSGKSTVARHVGHTANRQNQLLCSFFFKRDTKSQASTSRVIASLACDLARVGGPIAAEIAQSSGSARAGSREEFHALITEPLCHHPPEQPSLILIDALDESGLPFERAEFLTALIHEIPLLPPSVKVMVTSKPTQDIGDAFNKLPTASDDDEDSTVYRLTFDVYGQENGRDLLKYVSHTFDRVARLKRKNGISLPERWPSSEQRRSLVAHANGLFLWVSVAVNYVACATDPQQALDQLLALENRPSPEAAIDALYKHILHVAEESPNFNLPIYYQVLDLILNTPDPLNITDISRTLGQNAGPMIACLMPVLVPGPVVRIVHQSFSEYVRDVQKCEPRFLISPVGASMGAAPRSPPGSPPRRNDSSDSGYFPSSSTAHFADVASHPWAQNLPVARDVSQQIDANSISRYPIARGAVGEIWHARLIDGREVAIKCLRPCGPVAAIDRRRLERVSRNELTIWSQLDHPNVLSLLGICVLYGEIGMVSKWMPNGNALVYTQNHPLVDKLRLITDIAAGLEYLHSKQIVHGDMKGGNVVISIDGTARLVDFGLAKVTEESLGFSSMTGVKGTFRWMAPELINTGANLTATATFASDVYALGMTALEILTGKPPFLDLLNDGQVIVALTKNERPHRPSTEAAPQLSDQMWELMNRCWNQDKDLRPSAGAVHEEMRRITKRGNSGGLYLQDADWGSSASGAH